MLKLAAAVWLFVTSAAAATAGESPLICFGNEPSWSVQLTTPGVARVMIPDEEPAVFRGGVVRNEVLRESLWRGSPVAGRDLVVFLREGACSDTMSDTKHPVNARVSLPDGRFLAGCCRIPAPSAHAATTQPLEGVSWRLTGLPGSDAEALSALPRPALTRFEAGRIWGFSGCNNFTGSYTLEADRVMLGQLAGTLMACPEPASWIESTFRAAFAGTLRYAFDGRRLSLTAASGEVLTFEPEPEPRLEGVTWEVTGFNNNRHAVVSPVAGSRISFSFNDGTVAGTAGCNNFRASYSTQGSSIKIGPAATTRRACADELMVQEREFLAALESAVKWGIEGNVLDMHRADQERAIWAGAGR
jgi:heat shock protein HslJ